MLTPLNWLKEYAMSGSFGSIVPAKICKDFSIFAYIAISIL
jgi:hypothetical protein